MAMPTAMALRKEVLMVQNLQLLGFRADDDATPAARPSAASLRSQSSAAVSLHPNMFDRPNEKAFFLVLHFLLLKLQPSSEQELRFCWPIVTPHDKSNFKPQSVRDSAKKAKKKKRLSLPPSSSTDEQASLQDDTTNDHIFRRLDYDLDDENNADNMEL
ncbi:hypothetical protein ATCC90586_006029 [Pythium insidiosum]|nr:hypothetical protein ATCC90586_006029 [Pythium insidiosum]